MRLALPVLVLLALALAGCGSSEEAANTGETGGGGGEAIAISETEFALDPSSVPVDEAGTVTFRVTNDGSIPHALEVEGDDFEEETDTIEPGESVELTVDLPGDGSYELYCPIGNHREQGMEGELVVGAAGAGGGTGTMDDDEGTSTDDDMGGYGY